MSDQQTTSLLISRWRSGLCYDLRDFVVLRGVVAGFVGAADNASAVCAIEKSSPDLIRIAIDFRKSSSQQV